MGTTQGEGSHLRAANLALNLTSTKDLQQLLERHGLSPTKRLGQHFLISPVVVGKILDHALQDSPAAALEVGPGPGVLTQGLCERVGSVTCVEIDPVAVRALSETAPDATVLEADALEVNFPHLLAALPSPVALVSNMPYQITGPLLTRFTHARAGYVRATLMMQREVAQKILAQPGDREMGSISVFLQRRFNITRVCDAPPGAFYPPPKVTSMVLGLVPRPAWPEEVAHERLVRRAFAQPRKTLLNNLLGSGIPRETLLSGLESLGLSPDVRPHQIGLDTWDALTQFTLHVGKS